MLAWMALHPAIDTFDPSCLCLPMRLRCRGSFWLMLTGLGACRHWTPTTDWWSHATPARLWIAQTLCRAVCWRLHCSCSSWEYCSLVCAILA